LSESSVPPEDILAETEALREAENSHYHMMGSIIKRRLRGMSECHGDDTFIDPSLL
jgi:hypothetical protein